MIIGHGRLKKPCFRRQLFCAVPVSPDVTALLLSLFKGCPERYAARKQGYSRRFLSQDKYELYPGQTERCESHSVELDVGGWFVATHQSRTTIEASAQLACEILSLRYGSDIILNLRSRTPTR